MGKKSMLNSPGKTNCLAFNKTNFAFPGAFIKLFHLLLALNWEKPEKDFKHDELLK